MRKTLLFTVAFTALVTVATPLNVWAADKKAPAVKASAAVPHKIVTIKKTPPGFAGAYLAAHFAQSQLDWKAASAYLDGLLKNDPANSDLLKRAMVLSMAGGDLKASSARARQLIGNGKTDGLAVMIAALDSLADNHPQDALKTLDSMPAGDVTDFVRPMLRGWSVAATGKLDTTGFNATTVHSYNGALMALMLGNKAEAGRFARAMVAGGSVNPYDAERAADVLAAIGDEEEALKLYQGITEQQGGSRNLDRKIAAVKGKKDLSSVNASLQVKTARQGAAVTVFDLARILFQEESDATARMFGNMALALNPEMVEARMLMANALARSGHYDEALAYYGAIKPDNPMYQEVAHSEADMLQSAGRSEKALAILTKLYTENDDVDALIDMGDIERAQEKYSEALKDYNEAALKIGGDKIPEQYWYLLYARGMAYERAGEWVKAEADLKAALGYRPDHPYLLNYLAYGWAEQGVNLDESLKLVQRASALRPADGYIADSLGWVLFVMGRYGEAVPQLEKAVGLLPYDSTINDHLGDAYWETGRRLEAHFQWERALNNAAPAAKDVIQKKIASGPQPRNIVKEAKSDIVPAAVPDAAAH